MTEWVTNHGLWGLFVSAFVSSTLAPGGSEAVLLYLMQQRIFSDSSLLGVATFGNTLGAVTTWGLGYLTAARVWSERSLADRRRKAVARIRRWGAPVLLLSWMPVVGDGFCFAAGWLKLPFWTSVVAIAVGKALRYGAIIALFR